ncbi:MAG: hypothetical protein R3B49_06360 [Phycisphaerales bacterium]
MNDEIAAPPAQGRLDARPFSREAQSNAAPSPSTTGSSATPTGRPLRLAKLFGDHDDLLIVHNMGKGCVCTARW